MKTPLISHFWLNQESRDCNPGLEADIGVSLSAPLTEQGWQAGGVNETTIKPLN